MGKLFRMRGAGSKAAEKFEGVWNFLKVLFYFLLELIVIGGAIGMGLPASVSILVASVLSAILSFVFYKPLAKLLTNAAKGDINRDLREEQLTDTIAQLESEKRNLQQQLETADQTRTFFSEIKFGRKLEISEVPVMGYVVREESFNSLRANYDIAKYIPTNFWGNTSRDDNKRSMLLIEKGYHSFTIGIDLENIFYATRGSKVYLSGLEISLLHDISSELSRNSGDVDHCWVITTDDDGRSVIENASKYDKLEQAYRKEQQQIVKSSVLRDIRAKCRHLSEGMKESLRSRYSNLEFVDADERDYRLDWHCISKAGGNDEVRRIVTDMVIGFQFLQESSKQGQGQLAESYDWDSSY